MKGILYRGMIWWGCFVSGWWVGDLDELGDREMSWENIYKSGESYYEVLGKLYRGMVSRGEEEKGSEEV